MITLSGDFDGANKFIGAIMENVSRSNEFLATKGRERLKDSNKNSFRQQRTPAGDPWEISKLSQTDPTGSPRKTMIRSTNLFQDTQDNSNYAMNGYTLEQYTKAQSPKGFLYGYFHNTKDNRKGSGRWWFAGMDKDNLSLLTDEFVDYIFSGKK